MRVVYVECEVPGAGAGRQFPPFVWLLRDFTLNLAKAGRPITA